MERMPGMGGARARGGGGGGATPSQAPRASRRHDHRGPTRAWDFAQVRAELNAMHATALAAGDRGGAGPAVVLGAPLEQAAVAPAASRRFAAPLDTSSSEDEDDAAAAAAAVVMVGVQGASDGDSSAGSEEEAEAAAAPERPVSPALSAAPASAALYLGTAPALRPRQEEQKERLHQRQVCAVLSRMWWACSVLMGDVM